MKRKILIADDDETLRNLYTRIFSGEGYCLTLAGCVDEARRLLAANPYDLLITDLLLGDGEGTELLDILTGSLKNTKAIIVSGSAGPAERCLLNEKYNLTDYFNKPFDTGELLAAVKKTLA